MISNTIIQNRVQIEAFILIGGRSSRLGSDKAFVELGGQTLMSRAVETVRVALPETRVTLVAGRSAQFAIGAIASDLPFIFDLYESRGPLGGIHAALAHARTKWIFVLACDYPFVPPGLIGLLATKIGDDNGAVVPMQQDGRLQSLCAFYNVRVALPVIEKVLQRGGAPNALHKIVEDLRPRIFGFDEYSHLAKRFDPFININTLEDLESAEDLKRTLFDETGK